MSEASEIVLYVDDERENLTAFEYAFDEFAVRTAQSGDEALEVLRGGDVVVLLSDQRMPGMTGVELCSRARVLSPDAFRVIVTAYADVQVAIDAINRGEVNRFVMKPWRNEDLAEVVGAGIERARIERAIRAIQGDLVRKGLSGIAAGSVTDLVHEIVLPLRALERHLGDASGAVERIDAQGSDGSTARRALTAATEATALARALVRRVSHHVHSTDGPKRCNASSVVAASSRIAGSYAQRVAKLDLSVDLARPEVALDARSLGEIVLNLLVNAAEAVEARAHGNAAITVALRDAGSSVQLTVADNGAGLTPDELAHMFEPGFTTKGDGRGLGLAIVRSLVREVGGDVEARSEQGRGCTIDVRLPRASESQRP